MNCDVCGIDETPPYSCGQCYKAFCERHQSPKDHNCKEITKAPRRASGPVKEVDEENFDEEVIASRLPVIVDLYADWCQPCHIVTPIMDELAKEYEGRVKFTRLNVDENQKLSETYGTGAIPTLLWFVNGQPNLMSVGAEPIDSFRKRIEALLKNGPPKTDETMKL